MPFDRCHCARRPRRLTPTLLGVKQPPRHPSKGRLDFVSQSPQSPQASTEVRSLCSASSFLPTSTSALEFSPNFFWSFLGLFHQCRSAPPCLPVGGQCSDQWETGECLLWSAPAVMGAVEPHPLGRTVASSRRLGLTPSAPHHSLMQITGLFSPE